MCNCLEIVRAKLKDYHKSEINFLRHCSAGITQLSEQISQLESELASAQKDNAELREHLSEVCRHNNTYDSFFRARDKARALLAKERSK